MSDGVAPTARGVLHLKEVRAPTVARATLLRLARMPVGAAGLATAVAVLGDGVFSDQAAALADVDVSTAAVAADRLVVEGLMASAVPLGFAHPMVREAVYGECGPALRGRWHARAAELLAATGAGDERVAAHLLPTVPTGSETSAATLRRAARRAARTVSPDIAARYLARALAEPPPPGERGATALELGTAGFPPAHQRPRSSSTYAGRCCWCRSRRHDRGAWLLLSRTSAMDTSVPGAVAILDEALVDLAGSPAELLAPLVHERCGQGITHPETFASSIVLMGEPPATAHSPAERLALCHHANRRCFAGTSARTTEELALAALADGRLVHDLGPESATLHQLAYALAAPTDLTSPCRCWAWRSPPARTADRPSGSPARSAPARSPDSCVVTSPRWRQTATRRWTCPACRRSWSPRSARSPAWRSSSGVRWTMPTRCWSRPDVGGSFPR